MARKIFEVELEISENIIKFISAYAALNKCSVNEAFLTLINKGIQKGAGSLDDALLQGAVSESETLKKIGVYNTLQAVTEDEIKPANLVEESLSKNVDKILDDKVIEEIKNKYLKRK